jgi:hypothetical protein
LIIDYLTTRPFYKWQAAAGTSLVIFILHTARNGRKIAFFVIDSGIMPGQSPPF